MDAGLRKESRVRAGHIDFFGGAFRGQLGACKRDPRIVRLTIPSFEKLDLRTVLETPLREFVPWLAMVVLVSLAGYPGVVCVTPMAWLLALRVGNLCVAHSKSGQSSQRLMEAALAGGFLGFLQGMLFLVIV